MLRPLTSDRHRKSLSTALAAVLAMLVLLPLLGHKPLAEWDEAIYAEVSREMLGGGWLVPHWNAQPWLEKPPLMLWITAAFFKLFGVTEFWARAGSALSGVGIVALLHGWLLRREGLLAAWLSTLILLATFGFLHVAHVGEMDVLLSLGCCVSLIGLADIGDRRQSGWYLFWFGFAIALMTKGAASVVIPLTAVVFAGLERWRLDRFTRSCALGFVVFLALVLPWHLTLYHLFGQEFLMQYLGVQVLGRASGQIEGHITHWWFYLKVLLVSAPPFVLLYPFAIRHAFRRARPHPGLRVWAVFAPVVVGFFTVVQTRLPHYIAPAYPALALLTAVYAADRLRPWLADRRPASFWIGVGLAAAAVAGITIAATGPGRRNLHSATHADGSTLLDNRQSIPLLREVFRRPQPVADPLLLWRDGPVISIATDIFYSRRPVQQVQPRPSAPGTPTDRYLFAPQTFDQAIGSQPRLILLDRSLVPQIPREFTYTPLQSNGAVEIGTIVRTR